MFIREVVLSHEKGYSPQEMVDGKDPISDHFILYDGGKAAGDIRLVLQAEYNTASRLAVLKEYRSKGYGRVLMKALLSYARQYHSNKKVRLDTRLELVDLYLSLGFTNVSDVFVEENIAYQTMESDFGYGAKLVLREIKL